ncbi:LPXTG cell wall anchor domain-containing protein [Aeromicrobium ginsengisoli]|uniref:LPXTG cell wall anchor domain-containing protein n=1 Tax=Aeromicrobium ginsengisoli TaxID=363867 RepID=A0A5M4F9U7_9ACTN|nr:LPXTG cell wall anchor domain-containing protein [Aeromicrobium ginsengisoli]KAA1395186.1 LPXTG cell wall anchor domain-containing protein [Aeromicrobium ginsengisoli]
MIKLRLVAAAAIAAAATLLSSGAAQAYPDIPNVTLTISDATIVGGNTFNYKASADVECEWTVTYSEAVNGSATQTGNGKSLSGSYDTKVVESTFKSPIKATCKYDDNVPAVSAKIQTSNEVSPAFFSTSDAAKVLPAAIQTADASATITLLPKKGVDDNNSGSDLPDTGGSNLWILVLGGALVVAGGGVTYAARRRHTH